MSLLNYQLICLRALLLLSYILFVSKSYTQPCSAHVTVQDEATSALVIGSKVFVRDMNTPNPRMFNYQGGVLDLPALELHKQYLIYAIKQYRDGSVKQSIRHPIRCEEPGENYNITLVIVYPKKIESGIGSSPKGEGNRENNGSSNSGLEEFGDGGSFSPPSGSGNPKPVQRDKARGGNKEAPIRHDQIGKTMKKTAIPIAATAIPAAEPLPSPSLEETTDIAKTVEGKFAYDVPTAMKVGNRYKATVSITKSQNEDVLFEGLDSSKFKTESIKLTSQVKVALIDPSGGSNFSIQSLNTEEQFVDANSNTTWNWNVSPLKGGHNELILRATIKLKTDLGETTTRDVEVFNKQISVEASPMVVLTNFVSNYWQWLMGTFIIPIALWLINRRKKQNA